MRKFAVYIALFLAAVALFGRKPDAPSTIAPSPPAPPAISSPAQAPAQAPVETPGMVPAPTPVQTVPVPTPEKPAAVRMYVTGNGVGFRSGPSTTAAIIDRFERGREVNVLGSAEEWSQVRDQLSQREGWMATRFLSSTKPAAEEAKPSKPKPTEVTPQPPPTVSDAAIVQRIIAQSIASYPGSCPCPYNRDRGGRRCGKRSAYSKPGGYAPICFAGDVTQAMIEAYRSQ